MGENDKTYINMMIDILNSKEKVLDSIYDVTLCQSVLFEKDSAAEEIEATLEQKESLIKKLNRIDNGFSDAYTKVSAELQINKEAYKTEILEMQKKITELTDKGVKIQALENQNKIKFENYLAGQRRKIKDFKVNSKTVSSYYRNMTGRQEGESYFMDKKK